VQIKGLEDDIKQVSFDLEHLVDYAVAYYEGLLKKYGKGKERKTEIKLFDTIQAKNVAIANTKIYVNKAEGFIGTGLKKDEFLVECSEFDDIIAFTEEGIMKVVKVQDKIFIGKNILHAAVFRKGDERTTYNMIYTDASTGYSYAKRFNVTGITRDKEYNLTKGEVKNKVHYLSVNPNGEAEVVKIILTPGSSARKKEFEFYFETIEIKGRSSVGIQVTKHKISKVKFLEAGNATLGSIKLWFDDKFGRLNHDEKGIGLGNFNAEDRILLIYKDGTYEITDQDLKQRFTAEEILLIEKFDPVKIITAVYVDMDKKQFNVKRFKVETSTLHNKFLFIKEGEGNYLETVTTHPDPVLSFEKGRGSQIRRIKYKVGKNVEVTGWKAIGTRLDDYSKSAILQWVEGVEKKQGELFE
jgi:topoisomerase-4 subunit A